MLLFVLNFKQGLSVSVLNLGLSHDLRKANDSREKYLMKRWTRRNVENRMILMELYEDYETWIINRIFIRTGRMGEDARDVGHEKSKNNINL